MAELVGEGAFSKVYNYADNAVVKVVSSDNTGMLNELVALNKLHHHNIVSLIDVHFEDSSVKFILGKGESTFDVKMGRKNINFRRDSIQQILSGLAYMNSHFMMHLDVKPQNIIMCSDKTIKLIDFGSAIFDHDRTWNFSKPHTAVTLFWRAPEIALGYLDYDHTVDVWSVAVILMTMMLDEHPFAVAQDEYTLLICIFKLLGSPTEEEWPNLEKHPTTSKNFMKFHKKKFGYIADGDEKDLLFKMLTWPSKRIYAREALQHPYFTQTEDKYLIPDPRSYLSNLDIIYSCDLDLQRIILNMSELALAYNNKVKTIVTSILYMLKYIQLNPSFTNFKLLGVSCFFLAEDYLSVPSYPDINYIDNRFEMECTIPDIEEMKIKILKSFDYDLLMPTCIDFSRHASKFSSLTLEQREDINCHMLCLNLVLTVISKYSQKQICSFVLNYKNLGDDYFNEKIPEDLVRIFNLSEWEKSVKGTRIYEVLSKYIK